MADCRSRCCVLIAFPPIMELGDKLEQLNCNRLYRALGIEILETWDGFASSRMVPPEEFCWPVAKRPHGGIVFTQADTTMATCVMSMIDEGQSLSTIGIDIQYTKPALGEYLVCEARSTHRTKRMAFVRSETRSADGTLVALGQGTFRIFPETHGVDVI